MQMASPHQTKRDRPVRPCDACRKRKSRCVVEDDSSQCILCKFHSQECTFIQNPQSRKRKPTQSAADPDSRRRPSTSSVRSKKSPATQARIIKTTNGTGVEEYDELEGPSLLKKTLGLQNKHHSRFIGATCSIEPALLGRLSSSTGNDEIPLAGVGALRRVTSHEAFMLLPDPETQGYSDELDDLDAIEAIIRPHGKPLIDLYFRIVFPSYPILHKEVYLEKYARSYREFSPPLLAAVYLLALQYWTYDDQLSSSKKPDVPSLEELARKAVRDTIHRPKLSTVQAGLLLLQHTDTDSAELTAKLVSVAYGLGLHLDSTNWNIPDWEKGLRKRLGWGLYMQDKWSSMSSGRPPLINSSNWALQPVTSTDFPENASHEDDQEGSSEVEKGRILFTYMISLTQILSELLENVFTVKTSREIADAGDGGLALVLEKVKPVQLRLKEWYSDLPDVLSMETTNVMKLSSVGYLRLAYVATEITLHRRIILALSRQANPHLLAICRSGAHERFMFAIDFVQSLKPQHLSSFWYFASPQNFALIGCFGALLCATASNSQDADFYRGKLREYRWILKINSENGARFMKPAMAMLDVNMGLLEMSRNTSQMESTVSPHSTREQHNITPSIKVGDAFTYQNNIFTTGADFTSPGLYSFDSPYYSGQLPTNMAPTTYTPANVPDARSQDYQYTGMWSY